MKKVIIWFISTIFVLFIISIVLGASIVWK
ncbi:hypothetical protein DFP93_10194 [Aneurinibacillus soli]|uniref:Uncharacterized protein n=1 Tax=Aneurinibacillus soli TaxID=1500254 RepID=A0A0U5C768_9BACL|nr:hypothetical protein DFP93_10194 [Aneurinibacillus soli]BAU28019.1 hypothetical protein CB4_02193 [Aneurinibacillus soli]